MPGARPIPAAPSRLRRFDHFHGRGRELPADHPAVVEARPLFPTTRLFVEEVGRVLKSGHNSRKIGKEVTKGRWRGFPIFTLTLPERETCPSTCAHWRSCYDNNMHWSERIIPDRDFEEVLWLELEALNRRHPRGFVVRLHVLGDFYSVDYVGLWRRALDAFAGLNVFGYTARTSDADPIARALAPLIAARWSRFAVRYSGVDESEGGAVTIAKGAPSAHTVCPAQRSLTECCATCGLCWQSRRTIAFERH